MTVAAIPAYNVPFGGGGLTVPSRAPADRKSAQEFRTKLDGCSVVRTSGNYQRELPTSLSGTSAAAKSSSAAWWFHESRQARSATH